MSPPALSELWRFPTAFRWKGAPAETIRARIQGVAPGFRSGTERAAFLNAP